MLISTRVEKYRVTYIHIIINFLIIMIIDYDTALRRSDVSIVYLLSLLCLPCVHNIGY